MLHSYQVKIVYWAKCVPQLLYHFHFTSLFFYPTQRAALPNANHSIRLSISRRAYRYLIHEPAKQFPDKVSIDFVQIAYSV